MNLDEIVEELKETNYYEITSRQVEILAALSPEEYKQVVLQLLKEPVEDLSHLRGQEYRNTYRHRVLGCVLSALRPFDDSYETVLLGALGIADSTSVKYGALALSLIKPIEMIISDLLEITDKSSSGKEILGNVIGLLYWLGFNRDGSWHQREITISLDNDVNISLLHTERQRPDSDPIKVAKFAKRVSQFMN